MAKISLKTRKALRCLPFVAGVGLLVFGAGCGQQKVAKDLQKKDEQFYIDSTLQETFKGTYDRLNADNMNLASRIEGASATVGSQPGVYSRNSMNDVRVEFVVHLPDTDKDEALVIAANGRVADNGRKTLKNDQKLMDPLATRQYRVQAKCEGVSCSLLVVRLLECEKPMSSEGQEGTEATAQADNGQATAKPKNCEGRLRQAAMIFKRDEQTTVLTVQKASSSASGQMILYWSASGDSDFHGGTRDSYETASKARTEKGKTLIGNSGDPIQNLQSSTEMGGASAPSTAAPITGVPGGTTGASQAAATGPANAATTPPAAAAPGTSAPAAPAAAAPAAAAGSQANPAQNTSQSPVSKAPSSDSLPQPNPATAGDGDILTDQIMAEARDENAKPKDQSAEQANPNKTTSSEPFSNPHIKSGAR